MILSVISAFQQSVFLALVLTCGLLFPLWLGVGLSFRDVIAVMVICLLAVMVGRSLGTLLVLPEKPGFNAAFEIVGGFAVVSVVLLLLITLTNLSAIPALICVALLVAGLYIAARLRSPRFAPLAVVKSSLWFDLSVVITVSLLATLWSRQGITALRAAESTGVFPAWNDFFAHAAQIEYVKDYPIFERKSLHVAGAPQLFYHRASYTSAAAFAALAGRSTLETTMCFWLPLGVVLLGMSVYGFSSALAGRWAGAAAVAALFLLPDASMYGLKNGFFSFHWLVGISTSLAYGSSVVLMGLGLFVVAVSNARPALVGWSFALAATSVLFKVQIAAPSLPLFGVLFLMWWQPVIPWHRLALVVTLAIAAIGTMALLEHIPLAPHFFSGHYELPRFFDVVHGHASPDSSALYVKWTANLASWSKNLVGGGFLLVAAFGLLLPVVIALGLMGSVPGRPWLIRVIPFAMIGTYLITIYFLPTAGYGDLTEFGHRPFVLVYTVLVGVLAAELTLLIDHYRLRAGRATFVAAALTALLALVALRFDWKVSARLQHSSMPWGVSFSSTPIPRDLLASTRFIREQANNGDCVLSADGDPRGLVVALTERRGAIAFGEGLRLLGGRLGEVAALRVKLVAQLPEVRTYAQLENLMRQHDIQWLLLRPGEMPAWPDELLKKSIFRSGENRVFRFVGF